MKKIFLFILFFISVKCFGQYDGVQTIGNDSNVVIPKGALYGRIINHNFTDTTAANLHRIRDYPGAQIYTTSDEKFWLRNAATTRWVEVGSAGAGVSSISIASANGFAGGSSGGTTPILTLSTSITGLLKGNGTAISAAVAGTDYLTTAVTNFSAGDLSPLFTTSEATTTTTPALTFNLSNTGAYTVFGRAAGSGVPSFLASLDSNHIPHLHTEAYYNTKFLGINDANLIVERAGVVTGSIQTWYTSNDSLYLEDIIGSTYVDVEKTPDSTIQISLPITGTPDGTKFLRDDMSWQTIAVGGTNWGDVTGSLSDQTDLQNALDLKAALASPSFTGTVTFPSPFTLGATPVTPTGAELNFVDGVTSNIQTQLDAKESALTFSTGFTRTVNTVTDNLSTGVSGGQTIIGGTASGNSLTYSSTSNATKGTHIWGTTSQMVFDEVGNILRIGTSTAQAGFNLNVANLFTAGRSSATPISKLTFSNNTTGSSGLGIYTSTDALLSLFRANGPSIGTTLAGISKNNMTELLSQSGPLFLYTGASQPVYITANATAPVISVISAGRVGLNAITAPTAWIHLPASTTAASTASIKILEGSRQTTPEDGTLNYVANNLEFTETSTVYTLAKTLTAIATLDFDLTAVNYHDLTITVTGAADGDAILVGAPNGAAVADVTYFGWVSGTNTVTVRCSRVGGGGAANPASGTFRASVIKY